MKKFQTALTYRESTSRFPEFKPIDLEDRDIIAPFAHDCGLTSCEYSFANLYSWKDVHLRLWSLYEDRLLILDNCTGELFLPAGRPMATNELALLSGKLHAMGLSGNIALVPEAFIAANPDLANHYDFKENRNFADYIYATHKLAELKGKKLHKKRNLISQFKRAYPDFTIAPLTNGNRAGCLRLAQTLLARNSKISRTIREEDTALKRAMANFESVGFEGLTLLVAGRLVAFSIFSRLNGVMFDIHFEKADPAYKGAAQMINQVTASHLISRCRYLNREQDLGIAGLRQAKRSYDPERIEAPFTLLFRPPTR
jgi:hypothetical protein